MRTQEELIEAAYEMTGGSIKDLSTEKLKLMTVTQYVTDICLNEIEDRRELTFFDGDPVIPYESDYGVVTILTRP